MATKKTRPAPPPDPAELTGGGLELGPDLDLEAEEFTLRDGRQLTPELAEQLAREGLDEARRRNLVPGRKSLGRSTSSGPSPVVRFRVPDELLAAAEAKAADEGVTLSVLAREALEHYLEEAG